MAYCAKHGDGAGECPLCRDEDISRLRSDLELVTGERDLARDLIKKPVDAETIRLFGETPDTFTVSGTTGTVGGIFVHPSTIRRMAGMVTRAEARVAVLEGALRDLRSRYDLPGHAECLHPKDCPWSETHEELTIIDRAIQGAPSAMGKRPPFQGGEPGSSPGGATTIKDAT